MIETEKTTSEEEMSFEKLLHKLRSQFLCCCPIYSLQMDWDSIPENISWEQQEMLLQNTVGHPLNRSQPIKLEYQLNFFKRLIYTLELNHSEVHDKIYEEYCKMQEKLPNACTEEYIFKHYLIPQYERQLSMLEAKSFVGKGTTGLCTWEASLALSDFLLNNTEYAKNKNIFELGAGTGLCGMILILCEIAKSATLTDKSKECVELMRKNIFQNFPHAKEKKEFSFKINNQQIINIMQFPWEKAEKIILNQAIKPDLLLAADVVYDETLFKDLINAIAVLFKKSGENIKMLLSATVRNEETLAKFLKLLVLQFNVQDLTVTPEDKRYLYWDRNSIIRILEITRQKL